jgi:ABC-type transport system involved in multi-copper enzyme maturation permease subunit
MRLFDDPLAFKELRGATRRWQTYALRVLYVALTGLIVARFYDDAAAAGQLTNPSEYSNLSRKLFTAFLGLQLTFTTLAAVWAASDLVLKEARRGTLGLLYLTPLKAADVAFGKWKAAMAQSLALVLCGAPVMAVCAYLGGVGAIDLAWSLSLTLSIAGVAAAFSFHFSAAVRSQAGVMGLTLAAMLGFSIAPLWFGVFAGWQIFAFVHPVFAAGAALIPDATGTAAAEWAWVTATPLSFLFAFFLVKSSSGKLGKRSQDVPRPDDPILHQIPAWAQRAARLNTPRRVPDAHPLIWKEIATRAAVRMDADVQRAVFWIFTIFLGLAWLATQGRGLGMVYFAGFVFLVLAVVAGATLFSYEKEGRRFDMLLSTPVSNREIITAKLLAGVASPEALKALGLLALILLAWTLRLGLPGMAATTSVVLVYLVFAYVVSSSASLHAPNAQSAFMGAAGFLAFQLFILPLVAGPALAPLLHPVLLLQNLPDADRGPGTLDPGLMLALGGFCLIHLTAAAALACSMVPGLRRVTGRA